MAVYNNPSSIKHFFDETVVIEPNFHQEKQIAENPKFQGLFDSLADAKVVLNEAKEVNGARNKVITKRALAVLAVVATVAALAALIAIGIAMVSAGPVLPFFLGVLSLEFGAPLVIFATVLKTMDAVSTFNRRRDNATLKNGGVKMLKDAKENFNMLKSTLVNLMAQELPHATATELKALETHFVKNIESRAR